HHFESISIPRERGARGTVRAIIYRRSDNNLREAETRRAHTTVEQSDLVNVANHDDKTELVRRGVPPKKIVVLPYGISRTRRPAFDAVPSDPPSEPRVAFIGTFDSRKGASDFPEIVRSVSAKIRGASFRLMGTAIERERVLASFPEELKRRVEVIPSYSSNELPELLRGCAAGVFPSYIEGFGFGVLEMLAASIPVIAYNSPGPPMMLSPEYLVERGDTSSMAGKVVRLLEDRDLLIEARLQAKRRSQEFSWSEIARETSRVYTAAMESKRAHQAPLVAGKVNRGE